MSPERWQKIEQLFTNAQGLDPAARARYLECECGGDVALVDEVLSLLKEGDGPGLEAATDPGFLSNIAAGLDSPRTLAADSPFGPYRILHLLGAGAMGEVYLAIDTRLQRQVALKLLAGWLDRSDDLMRRFKGEALAASSLNHPNIPVVFEAGEIDGRRFIASEFVNGLPLSERLRTGPLPWREAVDIACKVAEALQAAHMRGIVHRDVKPGNIMVCPDGRVKLVDFGIAKFSEASQRTAPRSSHGTQVGVVVGTPGYMAPEQALGLGATPRSDVWSLAAVLHEMLTGKRIGADFSAARKMPGVPGRIRAALDHALSANPDTRTPTAGEFLTELHHGTVRAKTLTWVPLLAVAGVFAICVLAAVLWQSGLLRGPDPGRAMVMLRFDTEGADPADRYLLDGIQDEIQARLERISGLTVLSRKAVANLPPHPADLQALGARLGVGAMLVGNMHKHGSHVQVRVQLLASANGHELWQGFFERDERDLFDMEHEIAERVDRELRAGWQPGEREAVARHETNNPEAHAAFLRGEYLKARRDEDSLRKAVTEFTDATQLDPSYAKAYARLSQTWYNLSAFSSGSDERSARTRARSAAEHAVRLAPDMAEPHLALGWILLDWDWDLGAAEHEFESASLLAPNSLAAKTALATLYVIQGNLSRADAAYAQALKLDPLSTQVESDLAHLRTAEGKDAEAERLYREALGLEPKLSVNHAELALLALKQGKLETARREAQLEPLGEMRDFALAVIQQASGDRSAGEAAMQKLIRTYQADSPFLVARAYGYRGDANRTFLWLDRAYASRDAATIEFLSTPPFERFRQDPRYAAFRTRLGISPPGG